MKACFVWLIAATLLGGCAHAPGDLQPQGRVPGLQSSEGLDVVCNPVPPSWSVDPTPATVDEVEARAMRRIAAHDGVPQVPYGRANKQWLELRAKLRPGDTFHYVNDRGDWGASAGYAAFRGECWFDYMLEWTT